MAKFAIQSNAMHQERNVQTCKVYSLYRVLYMSITTKCTF